MEDSASSSDFIRCETDPGNLGKFTVSADGNVWMNGAAEMSGLEVNDAISLWSGFDTGDDRTPLPGSGVSGDARLVAGPSPMPSGTPAGGYGVIHGANMISPVIWAYGNTGNAIQFLSMPYDGNLGSAPTLMHVGVDGRVGIGTNSPSEELHVDGDIYCSGKLTSVGGNDPPYVLYDKETRQAIVERVADEVPPDKLDGAVLFWNGEQLQMEIYLPSRGEFRDLNGNVLAALGD
jgi:hypothetical protein